MRRRDFTYGLTFAAAAAAGGWPASAGAEPPPETRRVRLTHRPSLCEAPNYVAEELLKAEGFKDVQYVKRGFGEAEDEIGRASCRERV